ncbi:DUF6843 domain-containing protein [Sphingobacterium hotanense]|uniref:DUF6843 domain-containing protein n=1 Tax=Sphingobacterium hotanense TaxID=649196 RepID=UPI0021A58261|nr:hypothetical protein [Sphingobacterium hotanense]MCT1526914.1 hypothetical protein [Sphingobacterium hotanense]
MKYLFFISIILFMAGCTSKGEDAIYVLPHGYTGKVIILYGQESGDRKAYEGSKRLYNITETGVLKTQFAVDYNYKLFPEVYYDNNGKRIKIPVVADLTEADNSNVVTTLATTGKLYGVDGNIEFEYSIFYVGTNEQIRKSSEEVAKIDLRHLAKE